MRKKWRVTWEPRGDLTASTNCVCMYNSNQPPSHILIRLSNPLFQVLDGNDLNELKRLFHVFLGSV